MEERPLHDQELSRGGVAAIGAKADILVAGAGAAGCALARLLARAGRDVLVVERCRMSGKGKPCGGVVTGTGQRLMGEVYGEGVEHLAHDVAPEAAQRLLLALLALSRSGSAQRLSMYALASGSLFVLVTAIWCRALFALLLPPRFRRWRLVSALDASTGDVPNNAASFDSLRTRSRLSSFISAITLETAASTT